MRNRDFIITGESFAGKYIPCLATEILNYNEETEEEEEEEDKIPLKSLLIGNPYFGMISDYVMDPYLFRKFNVVYK